MRKLMQRLFLVSSDKRLNLKPDVRTRIEVGKVYRSLEVSWVIVKSLNEDGTVTIVFEDDRTNAEYTVMPEYLA